MASIYSDLDALYKDIHAHPELSGQEERTAALIAKELRAAGLRLAIATTTSPENIEVLLRTTLAALPRNTFEVIGAGDIVPAKKPAPDPGKKP